MALLISSVAFAQNVDAGAADVAVRDTATAGLAPISAEHRPQIRIEVPTAVPLGDIIRYVLRIDVRQGDDVTVPRQSFGDLEVHAQSHTETTKPDGSRELTFTFELLGFAPGEAAIPPLELRVVTADGTLGSARGEPRVVRVESRIGNEPNATLHPPSAPVVVMQDDYTLAWIGGSIALLLLGALIGWLFLRWWRKRPKALPPPPPPRPPWEIAFVRLRELRLRKTDLLSAGQHVEFVDGVNDTLREYFGGRFGFNGLESTTDEILSHLKTVHLGSINIHEVSALLSQCDLIKFAKAVPSNEMCEEILDVSSKIVRGTVPAAVQMDAQSQSAQMPGGRP